LNEDFNEGISISVSDAGSAVDSDEAKHRPMNLQVINFTYKDITLRWDAPVLDNSTDVLGYTINYHIRYTDSCEILM
jgi:hypothetical protein